MPTTATKTARTLQSSAAHAAGAATTGPTIDLTTAMGLAVTARITNGPTGPTTGCVFRLEVSNDNVNWKTFTEQTAGIADDGVYEFVAELGPAWMYTRSVFAGNTGQGVTIESFGHELTNLG